MKRLFIFFIAVFLLTSASAYFDFNPGTRSVNFLDTGGGTTINEDCGSLFVQNISSGVLECAAPSGSGDITSVTGNDSYILDFGTGANGDVNLSIDETKLNATIDARASVGGGNTTEEMQDAVGGGFGFGLIYNDGSNAFYVDISDLNTFIYNESEVDTEIGNANTSMKTYVDGSDDDTTYSNSTGLELVGTAFRLWLGYRVPQGCNDGEIAEYNTTSGGWDCGIDNTAASGMASWVLKALGIGGTESITDGETVTFGSGNSYIDVSRSTNFLNFTQNGTVLNGTIESIDTATNDSMKTYVDAVSGGNPFDQSLNTSDNPTFASLNITDNVTLNGSFDLTHNSIQDNDHAFEIDFNASGFADAKAIDINYETGVITSGDDEGIVLINIDHFIATGGDVFGLEVLSTEGGASVWGLKVGAEINVIHQDSGIFGNMDSGLIKEVNSLASFISSNTDAEIFIADNDNITIGDSAKFEEIEIIFNTTSSGAGISPTFEFSTGINAWSSFTPVDGTNAMTNNGIIAWDDSDIPTWATGLGSEYLIRITRTKNSLTTNPIEDLIQISSVIEYTWDEKGNLTIANVTADYFFGNGSQLTDIPSQLTQEEVEDYVGGMDLGTETRISVAYNDGTGNMDYVVDDMNDDVPDAGDFGNANDLDANGEVADDSHNHIFSNIDAFTETNLYTILSDVSLFLEDLVDDLTPQLGGDLDADNNSITNVSYQTFCNGANCWNLSVNSSDWFIIEGV